MTTGVRRPGEFCWINMLTPEPAKAREFFGSLLDWTYVEIPGMGHIVKVGNADETARAAAALGAKICTPMMEVPGVGRFCAIASPQGVPFEIIQYAG